MKEPKVAIIILTLNQKELLTKCLKSLKKNTLYKKYRVYVVDNGSDYDIKKFVKKIIPKSEIILNGKNIGFAKANNIGMKKAIKDYSPNYFLLVNDDIEFIDKGWLKKFIEVGESHKKIGIVGCKLIYPDGSLQHIVKKKKIYYFLKPGNKKDFPETSKIQEISSVVGACFLIKKTVVDKVGFLDEKFFLYGEETDLCERARKAGFKNMYAGNICLIHYRDQTISKLSKNKIWLIQKRSAIRFEFLNYSSLKIIKYSIFHLASTLFDNKNKKIIASQFPTKIFLLLKAYFLNFKDFKEIKQKRRERNNWLKNEKMVTFKQKLLLNAEFLAKMNNKLACKINRIVNGCDIGENVFVPKSTRMFHPNGIVIGQGTKLGENVKIFQNVTFGIKNNKYPIIEDDVTIYPNCVILGGVRIGKGSIIGAGTIILEDIPPNSIVYNKRDLIIKKNL